MLVYKWAKSSLCTWSTSGQLLGRAGPTPGAARAHSWGQPSRVTHGALGHHAPWCGALGSPCTCTVVHPGRMAPYCTVHLVHQASYAPAPRCIPAAWHRIAPCTTVHHHLCAPAPWCIPAAWHRGAPCTTVRDRPCAPALRCISATLHHGARCSTMCDAETQRTVYYF